MIITTATGTCLSVSAATPATHDEAGFAALAYTEVGELESLGDLLVEFTAASFTNLCSGKTRMLKGEERYSPVEIGVGLDRDDAGQTILTTARQSLVARVSVRAADADGTVIFFQALVMGEKITGGDGPNDVRRGAYTLGVYMPPDADPVVQTSASALPPTIESLAEYQDSVNPRAYFDVPYGNGESWDEYWNSGFIERQSQAFDIEVPAGTPPSGGWPVVLFLHSAGGTKTVVVGDSSVGTIVKGPALASGVAFASGWHRNPSTNWDWNGPGSGFVNTDPGRIIQKIRALAIALNLNPNAILVLGASKGNDYLTCTFAGDLQDPNAPTYAGRQSSIPNAGYSVQAQVYYDSAKWAAAFVPVESRAAFLAANPSRPTLPNAAEMVATANPAHVIPLAVVHEGAYVAGLNNLAVDDIHWAYNGIKIRQAYEAAGYGNRIVTWAGEPQASDRMGPLLEWWRHVRSGATPREAMAMARARSRNAALWYVRNDLSGIALGTTGAGPVTVDGVLGGIVDGSYGLSNRAALVGSLGVPCGQDTANAKPTLRAKGNGQYCVRFDGTNDKLACALTSDGSPNFMAFTDTIVTEYLAATTTTLQWGVSASVQVLANKDVSLMLASDTAIAATDAMIYTLFAQELSGVAYPSLLP